MAILLQGTPVSESTVHLGWHWSRSLSSLCVLPAVGASVHQSMPAGVHAAPRGACT